LEALAKSVVGMLAQTIRLLIVVSSQVGAHAPPLYPARYRHIHGAGPRVAATA
jgi:hypothetical protein